MRKIGIWPIRPTAIRRSYLVCNAAPKSQALTFVNNKYFHDLLICTLLYDTQIYAQVFVKYIVFQVRPTDRSRIRCHNLSQQTQGCSRDAIDKAAAGGYLDVVQWLHKNRQEGCSIRAMNHAALHGHLHVVKWLHENRKEGCTNNAMDNAAKNGHLDVVKFLHENRKEGCR